MALFQTFKQGYWMLIIWLRFDESLIPGILVLLFLMRTYEKCYRLARGPINTYDHRGNDHRGPSILLCVLCALSLNIKRREREADHCCIYCPNYEFMEIDLQISTSLHDVACRQREHKTVSRHHHNYCNHERVKKLDYLLTRSGLSHPTASSKVVLIP